MPAKSKAPTRPPPEPDLRYQADLMARSLEVLGRKWALLVLRDIAFLGLARFGEIQRNNPGLSPRILSRRLQDLQQEGVIERVEAGTSVTYRSTPRGEDALFILFAFLRYGMAHHAPGRGEPGPRPGPRQEGLRPSPPAPARRRRASSS